MPWYMVTISTADILAARHSAFERAFEEAFTKAGCPNAASLWCSHRAADGSITYFLSPQAIEISRELVAEFLPTECEEPSLPWLFLLRYESPLTIKRDEKQ